MHSWTRPKKKYGKVIETKKRKERKNISRGLSVMESNQWNGGWPATWSLTVNLLLYSISNWRKKRRDAGHESLSHFLAVVWTARSDTATRRECDYDCHQQTVKCTHANIHLNLRAWLSEHRIWRLMCCSRCLNSWVACYGWRATECTRLCWTCPSCQHCAPGEVTGGCITASDNQTQDKVTTECKSRWRRGVSM